MVDIVAAIYVRAHNLARRNNPAIDGRFHRAAYEKFLFTFAPGELRVKIPSRRRDVVHAIGEGDLQRILLAGFQHGFEYVVEAGFSRPRPAGEIEFVAAAERLAVQCGDILP